MIRKMKLEDTPTVLSMMKEFYASDAIIENVSEQTLQTNIKDCISELPYVEGFVLEKNGCVIGYTMIAKSYSTEFGGICIWIEDLYIEKEHRGNGYAATLFKYIEESYPQAVRFRLEVEQANVSAITAYEKNGYKNIGYKQMSKVCKA